eukprot:1511927-Rhodomonas_salina.3
MSGADTAPLLPPTCRPCRALPYTDAASGAPRFCFCSHGSATLSGASSHFALTARPWGTIPPVLPVAFLHSSHTPPVPPIPPPANP